MNTCKIETYIYIYTHLSKVENYRMFPRDLLSEQKGFKLGSMLYIHW